MNESTTDGPVNYRPWLFLGFVAACVLTYLSVFTLPYFFMDDNWIVRTEQHGSERSLRTLIALTQGRPVMAVLLKATRIASTHIGGLQAMRYARLGAMILLGVFGYILFRWLVKFEYPAALAVCLAAMVISLPAAQILVAGGPWLAVGLVSAGCAIPLAFYLWERPRLRVWNCIAGTLVPLFLLIVALCTYQQIFLVSLGFLMVPTFAFQLNKFELRRFRTILIAALIIFSAVLAYHQTWKYAYKKLMPNIGEARYNPTAIIDLKTFRQERIKLFRDVRVVQAANLWTARIEPALSYRIIMWTVAVGLAVHLLRVLIVPHASRALGILDVLVKVIVGALLCLFSDIFLLAANNPVTSYTTLFGLTLTICIWFGWSLNVLLSVLPPLLAGARWQISAGIAAACCCAVMMGAAQKSVTMHFALPLHMEITLYKDEILRHHRQHNGLDSIIVYQRGTNLNNRGHMDFSWGNLTMEFYIFWTTQNVLEMANLPLDVKIYSHRQDGVLFLTNPPTMALSSRPEIPPLVVDMRHLTTK